MPTGNVNIAITAPKVPTPTEQSLQSLQQYGGGAMTPQVSGEGYKLVDRIVDPNAIYLDKLTMFLYSARLVKTKTLDPDSPLPGFTILKIGGDNWKPNVNLLGYTTIASEILMALAEDGSITRFPDYFKLEFFCARQVMSIIGMMMANREEWEFTNYTIIYPFGHTLWKAMVATLSRSRTEPGRRTLMDMLVHPNLWFSQGPDHMEAPKRKWFYIEG